MAEAHADIPSSVRIPFEHLIQKYGPYFWTSTIAYMLAVAIDELAPRAQAGEKVALGLWGIDMSSTEEWNYQRPGCQHFVGLAMSMGIQVVLPVESDLMRPPTMYGIGEMNPRHIRLLARRAEAEANRCALTQQHDEIIKRTMSVTAQLAEMDYMLSCWTDDITPDLKQAVSFSNEFVKPIGELTKAIKEMDVPQETTGAEVIPIQETKTG